MQFMRQGTKVFIKLKLRKIHDYLYFAVFIHSTFVNLSQDDSYVFKYKSAAYMRVNKSDIFLNHKRRDIV